MGVALTSKQALKEAEQSGRAGYQRYKILRFMVKHPRKQGWTRTELSQRLNMPINVISGRVFDLVSRGLIDSEDKKVCTVTARYVEALKLVN